MQLPDNRDMFTGSAPCGQKKARWPGGISSAPKKRFVSKYILVTAHHYITRLVIFAQFKGTRNIWDMSQKMC
jgi:hypothetical protein